MRCLAHRDGVMPRSATREMAAYAMAMISTAVGGWLSDDDAASDPGFWGGVVDGLAAVVSTHERLRSG